MANVTKKELLELVRRKAEKTYSNNEVDDIITSLTEVINEELENGNTINLRDLGTFTVVVREARTGRNPRTGESIDVPEKCAVHFKVSNTLKNNMAEIDTAKFRKAAEREKRSAKVEDKKSAREASGKRNRR